MSEGDRIATLKRELDTSLKALPAGTNYKVIYYSHRPWLGGEDVGSAPFRDPEDARDRVRWSRANAANIAASRKQLAMMQLGGATNWIPPVQLALAMNPRPEAIFLMTDGEGSDSDELVADMHRINPRKIPIHTVGMEIGGSTWQALIEVAEKTGGRYALVRDGMLFTGERAREFAADE